MSGGVSSDDGTVDSAVDTAMQSLVALDPDDLDTAMIEVRPARVEFVCVRMPHECAYIHVDTHTCIRVRMRADLYRDMSVRASVHTRLQLHT